MLSGNCQAVHICIVSGYRPKPKLSSFILFLMHSGGKFREDIDPNNLKYKLVTPVLNW